MTFRSDSDVVVRWDRHVTRDTWHVTRESNVTPQTRLHWETAGASVGAGGVQVVQQGHNHHIIRLCTSHVQVPLPDFSHYTYPHFRERGNTSHPPIVWFVSHCNAHSGRFKHKRQEILRHHEVVIMIIGTNTSPGWGNGSAWTSTGSAGRSSAGRWGTCSTSTPPPPTPALTLSTGSTGERWGRHGHSHRELREVNGQSMSSIVSVLVSL